MVTSQSTHGLSMLLDINRRNSQEFRSRKEKRQEYRRKHPTEIAAFKCMDGRINLSCATQTEMGIIHPYRNIGGKFELRWPQLKDELSNMVRYAEDNGKSILIFCVYHWSAAHPHLGCAGHQCDKDAAMACAAGLRDDLEDVFKDTGGLVVPILIGFNTDYDTIVLHGYNGESLDLLEFTGDELELELVVHTFFKGVNEHVLLDLMPLLTGNMNHTRQAKAKNRTIHEVDHQESVIAIGLGYDWLHQPNTAFIINHFDPNLDHHLRRTAELALDNLKSGRSNSKEIVLMSSAIYRRPWERGLAVRKSEYLFERAQTTLREFYPEVLPYLRGMTGCVNMDTREFHVLNLFDQVK